MIPLKILLNTIAFLGAFLLFASFLGFYTSIRPPKIVADITPKELGFAYDQVTFTTEDGLNLAGWFVPSRDKAMGGELNKTIILLHGYPADKGDILPSLAFLHKKYNLFLFDFRYFGQSQGAYSAVGAKETNDLTAAIRYLKTRGIHEAGVWGFSLGGAVALMTAPRAPEIKAIVSEASYARLDLMAIELYRIPVIKFPLAYLTGLWARIFFSIDMKAISPAASGGNLHIPILIAHSQNDEVIPFQNALLIQEALKNNPRAEFWFEENLEHGRFGDEYQKRIEDFFERNL